MIRSMTGYGGATVDTAGARIVVEVRGVNQRHLDVRVSGSRELVALEAEIRDAVRARVERGRVEVAAQRLLLPAKRRLAVTVHEEVAAAYVRAARRLARAEGLVAEIPVADLLRLPDVVEVGEADRDARAETAAFRQALDRALDAFDRERAREGRRLARDMRARLAIVAGVTARLRRGVPAMQQGLRARLLERARRLAEGADVDPGRLAYEVASMIDRGDVSEEIVRLESHLAAVGETLRAGGPIGKRVEFLLQEVLRELNTTGAKVADPALTAHVVAGKEAVEKLREQVQNVE
jgi:uncharacterized protein (TIGR00255 family)